MSLDQLGGVPATVRQANRNQGRPVSRAWAAGVAAVIGPEVPMIRWGGVVLAVMVVAGLGTAVPSAADPPGIVKVGDTTGASSADKSILVSCPAGTVVSGGGGYVPMAAAVGVQGFVGLDRLEPLNNGGGFIATMREFQSTLNLWTLSGDAICVTAPAGYDVVAFPGPVETQVASGSCGAKNLIGVGGRINNGGGDVVLDYVTPWPNLKGVTVRGTPIPGRDPVGWSVTAFAVCADVFGLERITWADPLSGNAHKAVSKTCPVGKGLYSPGAAISPGSGQVYLSLVRAITTNHMATSADEAAGEDPPDWALIGYGICG